MFMNETFILFLINSKFKINTFGKQSKDEYFKRFYKIRVFFFFVHYNDAAKNM